MFNRLKLTKYNITAILSSLFIFYVWLLFCLYIIFVFKKSEYNLNFDIQQFNWSTIAFSIIFIVLTKVVARSDGYIYSIQNKNNLVNYINKTILDVKILFFIFSFSTGLSVIYSNLLLIKFILGIITFLLYFLMMLTLRKRFDQLRKTEITYFFIATLYIILLTISILYSNKYIDSFILFFLFMLSIVFILSVIANIYKKYNEIGLKKIYSSIDKKYLGINL